MHAGDARDRAARDPFPWTCRTADLSTSSVRRRTSQRRVAHHLERGVEKSTPARVLSRVKRSTKGDDPSRSRPVVSPRYASAGRDAYKRMRPEERTSLAPFASAPNAQAAGPPLRGAHEPALVSALR